MDKILYGIGRNEGQVQVTNDGATILKAVGVDNPCAKVLVDMSKVQDDEVSESKFDKNCLNLSKPVIPELCRAKSPQWFCSFGQ